MPETEELTDPVYCRTENCGKKIEKGTVAYKSIKGHYYCSDFCSMMDMVESDIGHDSLKPVLVTYKSEI